MNLSPGGVPITTRRILMQQDIAMSDGSVALRAISLSEYHIMPHLHYSAVTPARSTEKIITFSGKFMRDGGEVVLTLHRKLTRDEITRALARINLLNEFFSDVGRRFEFGIETLIPLFDGLQAGFRKIDVNLTATVFIFEQAGARGEFLSESVGEMTDLRDGLGNMLSF